MSKKVNEALKLINELRKEAGIHNAQDLAEKIGVCYDTAARWMRGETQPNAINFEKLKELYKKIKEGKYEEAGEDIINEVSNVPVETKISIWRKLVLFIKAIISIFKKK